MVQTGSAARPKLRTKTGCLTCRQRRKKCDETTPVCEGCKASRRQCKWPTEADLLDRRYASHYRSRYLPAEKTKTTTTLPHRTATPTTVDRRTPARPPPSKLENEIWRLLSESAAAHGVISRDMEVSISRHFADRYYDLILLPSCDVGFHDGWLHEIQSLMVDHKSLYYSVLACAAAHIHFTDESSQMQELSLTYYSNALRKLSGLLSTVPHLADHNGLLMSVMLLYLHGCMGRGTYSDIPRHLTAATQILSVRLQREQSSNRQFDRLATESVMYQIFIITTGLWSEAVGLDYAFDTEFWALAENWLDQTQLFPGRALSFNSPVLGVPVSLLRLVICIKHLGNMGLTSIPEKIRSEVEVWEAALLVDKGEVTSEEDTDPAKRQEEQYRDATSLYAIVASMLLEQVSQGVFAAPPKALSSSWQMRKAEAILRRRKGDEAWATSFIGNWPVYTLGCFTSSPDMMGLVQEELHLRWDMTRSAQLARFRRDLEKIRLERDHVLDPNSSLIPLV